MNKSIIYEGPEPLYFMCLKNPELWNNYYGWMIEEIAPIWEKINIPSKKTKLSRREKDFFELRKEEFKAYTFLVHLYNNLPEDKKDEMQAEWNSITSKN